MSLCTGQVVYASLAQMSVKGAANNKLEQLSVGMLDVFSSSFWTHPGYAHSVIRNCDEELSFTLSAAGVRIFQPPRSMDVVYNMFAVIDIPGLVNIATLSGDSEDNPVDLTLEYEVISDRSMEPFYTLKVPVLMDGVWTYTGANDRTQALLNGIQNLGGDYLCGTTSDGNAIAIGTATDQLVSILGDNDAEITPAIAAANKSVCFRLDNTLSDEAGKTIDGDDYQTHGTAQVVGDMPHYVDSIGQYLIQDVEMTIGGARVGLLNSNYMYIHEELFGHPGRRQEDAIGKTAVYEPEASDDAGRADLQRKSMVARRLYVQLPFWWTGGKMERALKTIALQLHKIEFKVQTRQLKDCIAYASTGGQNLPGASSTVQIGGGFVDMEIATHVRMNEHIDESRNKHLIGAVRANANGGDVAMGNRTGGLGTLGLTSPDTKFRSYLQMDFCGIFLNQESRDKYLKLDEKTLFTQVLGTDTDGIAMSSDNQGVQTETLNFNNGVYDIIVGVSSDRARDVGDVFGFRGTSMDGTTGFRDDALETLSFDISSTPRTIANLSAEYYREVTQFLAAKTKSELKGLYYYNVQLFDELNGTRCVNSFINASKIDDLRCRFKLNNGAYNGGAALPSTDNKLLDDGSRVYFYAHVYNTLQIRNGMAGAMFA